ncbi:translation initiation factor IF-2 isoform X3 [Alligator mississippiensis]|uniref:translation initiation factor IF-2 isoform X3 n=1 Tax=Alligator mississippiensis TaxID=8496 RepID=UPI002877D863|nr:translation initiation factor IF-2 isoform X3 [Alligator mississippiensis]
MLPASATRTWSPPGRHEPRVLAGAPGSRSSGVPSAARGWRGRRRLPRAPASPGPAASRPGPSRRARLSLRSRTALPGLRARTQRSRPRPLPLPRSPAPRTPAPLPGRTGGGGPGQGAGPQEQAGLCGAERGCPCLGPGEPGCCTMEQGAPGTILLTQISPPSTRPKPLEKFQRGEPLAVGVTQVLTGIQQVAFGTVLILTFDFHYPALHLGAVVCTGLLCVVSGSLSVAVSRNPKIPLMKMELALNSVSAVVAGVSIVMLCLSVMFTHNAHSCYWHQGKRNCDYPPKEVQAVIYQDTARPTDPTCTATSGAL